VLVEPLATRTQLLRALVEDLLAHPIRTLETTGAGRR
jgi:hypothetical protein